MIWSWTLTQTLDITTGVFSLHFFKTKQQPLVLKDEAKAEVQKTAIPRVHLRHAAGTLEVTFTTCSFFLTL